MSEPSSLSAAEALGDMLVDSGCILDTLDYKRLADFICEHDRIIRAAERERCAQIAESMEGMLARYIADAIRKSEERTS